MNQDKAVVWFIYCFLFNMCFSKKVGAKAKLCLMTCAAVREPEVDEEKLSGIVALIITYKIELIGFSFL